MRFTTHVRPQLGDRPNGFHEEGPGSITYRLSCRKAGKGLTLGKATRAKDKQDWMMVENSQKRAYLDPEE